MRKMKFSGFAWIGDVPEGWQMTRIGNAYTERRTKVSDYDYPPLSVTNKGIVPQLSTAAKSDAHDDRKLVLAGDFAINSRSDRRGSCGISKYDGSVSLINTILTPRIPMNPNYYDWFFHTTQFADEFYKWGHGIVDDLWTTTWQDMKKIAIPVPPLEEQNLIAKYIDTECGHIDAVIAQTKAAIEEYKTLKQSLIVHAVTEGIRGKREMKNCELEWIDAIPVEWKITSAKRVLKKLERPMRDDDQVVICSNSGKTFYRGAKSMGLVSLTDNGYQGVEPGDLLIHGMDTWHGAIAVSDIRGKCTSVVHVCDTHENKRYICYYLQSLAFRKVYKAITNGVRQNTSDYRSWEKAGTIMLVLPSRDEQLEIADYLDEKCAAIDELIAQKELFVAEIENYRRTLIYEYVTGKKEVPAE